MLIGLSQLIHKLVYLGFQFNDLLVSGIVVPNGLICDEGSLGGIGKGWYCFIDVVVGGVQASDHKTVAISTDWLF